MKKKTIEYIRHARQMAMANCDLDVAKDLDSLLDQHELIIPFNSTIFIETWETLLTQPKWRRKSKIALQAALKILSKTTEQKAIEAIERTIAGNYQGIFLEKTKEVPNQVQHAIEVNNGVHDLIEKTYSNERNPRIQG
nr:hypothetical protein [uncultured Flavobacterium sp.]